MTKLTRRAFLRQTPISAATLSLLPTMPALAGVGRSAPVAAPRSLATNIGSMIVHVKDVATGEMAVLVGSAEIAVRDPRLVADLVAAIDARKPA